MLTAALSDPDPLARGHAAWALGRVGSAESSAALSARLGHEADDSVVEEIRAGEMGSSGSPELRAREAARSAEIIVVTHWKVGRHRDHRIASELVRDACFLSGLKKLDAPGVPFRPLKLVYATAFREDAEPPDFVVDVSQQLRKKLEALSTYSSQFDGVRGIGEVYPGGERPVLEQVRAQMAHSGTYIRVEYGEDGRAVRRGEPRGPDGRVVLRA